MSCLRLIDPNLVCDQNDRSVATTQIVDFVLRSQHDPQETNPGMTQNTPSSLLVCAVTIPWLLIDCFQSLQSEEENVLSWVCHGVLLNIYLGFWKSIDLCIINK